MVSPWCSAIKADHCVVSTRPINDMLAGTNLPVERSSIKKSISQIERNYSHFII